MDKSEPLNEYEYAKKMYSYPRSPFQLNKIFESDSEILRFENGQIFLSNIDAITTEAELGLYKDPFQIGWLSVMSAFSDIAACGGEPIGAMQAVSFPKGYDETRFYKGVKEALSTCGTYLLGGDTSSGSLSVTTTAFGCSEKVLKRTGSSIGDLVFTTGGAGLGNFYVAKWLEGVDCSYFPKARLDIGKNIVGFSTSCIDTSDGFFSAISTLGMLNGWGVKLCTPLEKILHGDVHSFSGKFNYSLFSFLAGEHGDYELVFTCPAQHKNYVLEDLKCIYVGEVVETSGIWLNDGPGHVRYLHHFTRNLFSQYENDLETYFREFFKYADKYKNLA